MCKTVIAVLRTSAVCVVILQCLKHHFAIHISRNTTATMGTYSKQSERASFFAHFPHKEVLFHRPTSFFSTLAGALFCNAVGPGCERKFIPLQNDVRRRRIKKRVPACTCVGLDANGYYSSLSYSHTVRRARARAVS